MGSGLKLPLGGADSTASTPEPSAEARELAVFALLVDEHYAPLAHFLLHQTGDPELAADLTQATFLAAFRSRRQLATAASFPAWLYQIARNEVRMEWRRRGARRWLSLEWLPGPARTEERLQSPDPSGPCLDRDGIQRALDQLTPGLRDALLLHAACGFPAADVASLLGISPAAARKRIARAATVFRAAFVPDGRPTSE